MAYLAEKSRADAVRIRDPEFDDYLNAAVFDALEKTSAGLAAETVMFGKGLRIDPTGITCPIAVWHGVENAIVPVSSSTVEFADRSNATVTVLADTGLFLGQQAFEAILGWLQTVPMEGQN